MKKLKKLKKPTMKKQKKPTKLEVLTEAVVQDYRHSSTLDISRVRRLVFTEAALIDAEIMDLSARLAEARVRRSVSEARLAGLEAVVKQR